MSETPFIKFFPGDFLGGVGGLSPTERGVYITILCLIWDGGGPVQMDEGRLARRCGMPKASFQKSLAALIEEGKLVRTPGGITNERAEKTLMDRQIRVEKSSNAANQRWAAQREKSVENQQNEDATASQGQCLGDAKPEARSQIYGGGGGSARAHTREHTRERTREAQPDQTFRERILAAVGADPISGLIGPNGVTLGTQADMAVAARWTRPAPDGLGLTEAECLTEIAGVIANKRDGPPSRLSYFTPALQRLAAAKASAAEPLPPAVLSTAPKGAANVRVSERRAFDSAVRAIADDLSAGRIHLDDHKRDPFGQR